MGAALALLSSALWGGSDFLGGLATRRASALLVVLVSQLAALVGLAVVVPLTGAAVPSRALVLGAAAGVAGAVALGCFYRALASGVMGVVSPVAATGAVVPLAVGLARGDVPSPVQLAGVGAAVVGVVLAARTPSTGRAASRTPVLLALVAAAGFGTTLVLIGDGGRTSVAGVLLGARATSVALLALVAVVHRRGTWPRGAGLGLVVLTGVGDVSANALYAVAASHGLLSLVAVLGSLYPVVTVLLARRVLHEHLRRSQLGGISTALLGVVLIAAG